MVNRTLCDFFGRNEGRHPIVYSSSYILWKFSEICWNRVIAKLAGSSLDKGRYNENHVFLQRYARGFFTTSPLRGWYPDLLWPTHVIVYFYYVNNVNVPARRRSFWQLGIGRFTTFNQTSRLTIIGISKWGGHYRVRYFSLKYWWYKLLEYMGFMLRLDSGNRIWFWLDM